MSRSLIEAPRDGGSTIGAVATAVADSRVDEVRDRGLACERKVRTHRRCPRTKPALTKIARATSDERRATKDEERATKKIGMHAGTYQ